MNFLAMLSKPYYTPIECSGWCGAAALFMEHGAVRWLGALAPPAGVLLSAAVRKFVARRTARQS